MLATDYRVKPPPSKYGERNGRSPWRARAPAWSASGKLAGLTLAAYFLLAALGRVLVSDSTELDEAEQLVLTQSLQWGYVSQPPLYTWLQSLCFGVLGTRVAALAALKGSLLLGSCFFVYHSARAAAGSVLPALAATVSLCFIPQFLWESQRDLTHSVLVTMVAAATLWVFLRLLRSRRPADYLWFGLCAGLGMLSKYNYAFFLVALLGAALSLASSRRVVWNEWMLASLGIFCAITLPHWIWVKTHLDLVLSQAPANPMVPHADWVRIRWLSLWSLAKSTGAFLGPLLAVYLALFGRGRATADRGNAEIRTLIQRTLISGLILCLIMTIVYPVGFKDRWLQPLLFVTPVYLALIIQARLDATRMRRLVFLAAVAASVALVLLSGISLSAGLTGRPTRLNAPYAALARQLLARGVPHEVVLADSLLTAGNLRLALKPSEVLAPEGPRFPVARHTPWLAVWDATTQKDPPPELCRLINRLRGRSGPMDPPAYVEASLKYDSSKSMTLGYALLLPVEKGGGSEAPTGGGHQGGTGH